MLESVLQLDRIKKEDGTLIVLGEVPHSAEAIRLFEEKLMELSKTEDCTDSVDIDAGNLLLSSGVLVKLQLISKRYGTALRTVYSLHPQTQLAALDEGLIVRSQKPSVKSPSSQFDFEAFVEQAYSDLNLPKTLISGGALSERAVEDKIQSSPFVESEKVALPLNYPVEAPVKTLAENDSVETLLAEVFEASEDNTLHPVVIRPIEKKPTLYYKQNLRSGQVLESEGHIVIIGDVHSGSEIHAEGDILVWGTLNGIAHAGRNGDSQAEIRAVKIEAVQIRIADKISRRPDRLFKLDTPSPRGLEVAKIKQGEIQIFEDSVSSSVFI
jgi:septum site-determining protein MinC